MKVIRNQTIRQEKFEFTTKRHSAMFWPTVVVCCVLVAGIGRAQDYETHWNLQAVNANGTSAWTGTHPFKIRGVLLCNPDEMLDYTPNFLPYDPTNTGKLGGQWQIAFQAVDPSDRGGTFCYMAQNYGNLSWIRDTSRSYSNEAWTAEVLRLNFDPATMHQFRAGDLIEVTANISLFYGGKRNINEAHYNDPQYNFYITLVQSNYGLPEPEVITLANIKNPDDTYIFDQTRAVGGEHYQGMRVRINNLTLLTTNGWTPANSWAGRLCTATDGTGRTLPLRHPRYSLGPPPEGVFDAIGIFNQESGSGSQGTNGYELFLQQVIPQQTPEIAIASKAMLSWPDSGAIFQVEYSTDLTNWHVLNNPVFTIGSTNIVLDEPTYPHRFYRLRRTN